MHVENNLIYYILKMFAHYLLYVCVCELLNDDWSFEGALN